MLAHHEMLPHHKPGRNQGIADMAGPGVGSAQSRLTLAGPQHARKPRRNRHRLYLSADCPMNRASESGDFRHGGQND